MLANLAALGYGRGEHVLLDAHLVAGRRAKKLSSKKAFRSLLCNLVPEVGRDEGGLTVADLVSGVEALVEGAPGARRS